MRGDIHVGECLVRSQLNTIANGEREVRLEPKAMQVLALLLERPGDVVSREEMLSRVWHGRLVSDEVLTNAVSQLRRGLGDDPKKPRYIQTIAKNGYRLIAPVSRTRDDRRNARWVSVALVGASVAALAAMTLRLYVTGESYSPPRPVDGLVLVSEFDSLSMDADLEWLRTGIAELMVTGMSQRSRLHLLGPSESAAVTGLEAPRPDLVIAGSFARFGARLRIDAYAKDTATGEIVAAESAESASREELFETVDELAARLAVRLELVHEGEPHLSRTLRDITTGSFAAYQHYVEGMRRYYYNLDHVGALERYEEAVELDPSFAMAFGKMAILYMNVGDYAKADASARHALEHLDRLPAREQHYVTGNFYVTREESYARALVAYNKALELDTLHLGARHNLAFIYFRLERYREAIEELEKLVRSGVRFPGSYRLLMLCYAALGEFEEGQRIARVYLERNPEKWIGYRNLGQHLMRWGRLTEASEALDRADALRPGALEPSDWWQLQLLTGESTSTVSAGTPRAAPSSAPHLGQAMHSLYAGKPQQALVVFEEILAGSDTGSDWAPVVLNLSAEILLQIGENERSLELARRAQELGRGNAVEWQALSLASRAAARLGDWSTAERLAQELERRTASIPTHKERRRLHHLRGELALMSGDTEHALDELERAEKLLSPRGFPITIQIPQHVPIRYARAEAYRAAGRFEQARRWYQSVADSTTERLVCPIPFVRSLHRLGRLHEAAGDVEQAVSSYRRFLVHWDQGDIDRDDVEAARARVAAYEASRPGGDVAAGTTLYLRRTP